MTQKELLYYEDAISHEKNIISYLKDAIDRMNDRDLCSFLERETKKHKTMQEKLMKKLKEIENEWSNFNG